MGSWILDESRPPVGLNEDLSRGGAVAAPLGGGGRKSEGEEEVEEENKRMRLMELRGDIMTGNTEDMEELLGMEEDERQAGLAWDNKKIRKSKYVVSTVDTTLVNSRILDEMLIAEKFYCPASSNYTFRVQNDITAAMRKTVTDWMLEVCQETQCSGQVFLLSIQFLDRMLSCLRISKSQLQLLATSCLFISSKLCEIRPFSVEKLVIYTDCSISSQEILSMEMVILNKLNWELAAPTSLDFITILGTLYNSYGRCLEAGTLRRAGSYLALAATEYQFYAVRPSHMAAAALLSAIQSGSSSLLLHSSSPQQAFHSDLATTLSIDKNYLSVLTSSLSSRVDAWLSIATVPAVHTHNYNNNQATTPSPSPKFSHSNVSSPIRSLQNNQQL